MKEAHDRQAREGQLVSSPQERDQEGDRQQTWAPAPYAGGRAARRACISVERSPGPCWPGVSLQQHRNSLPSEQLQEGPQCPCKEHLVFPAYHTLVELKGLPGWVPSPRTTKGTGPRSISEGMPHSQCRAPGFNPWSGSKNSTSGTHTHKSRRKKKGTKH